MKKSIYLGRIVGIKLFIHWSFFILPAWVALSAYNKGQGSEEILWNLLFIFTLFGCVTLHEFGHALVAKHFHYKTKNITLLPIGGVANMESLPEDPKQELAVAIAGPIVNVIIAILLYGYLAVTNNLLLELDEFELGQSNFLFVLMAANLFIAAFNMVPAFPMDGGRVLRALLALRLTRAASTQITSAIGQFIAVFFIVFGLFYNIILVLIGVFVLLGARSEWFIEHSRFILGEHKVGDILIHHYQAMKAEDHLDQAVLQLLDSTEDHFLVMEGQAAVGTINRSMILQAVESESKEARIRDVMDKELHFLTPETKLSEVYNPQKSKMKSNSLMPVMENGDLIGVLDIENIAEFIQLKTALNLRKAKTAQIR